MLQAIARGARVTCPAPESLVPHALGASDPTIAGHVEGCSTCQAELARLREAAGVLRGWASLERRVETPECLDELAIADFVEGRLAPAARAPVVAHLLMCARCRSVVRATARLLVNEVVAAESRGAIRSLARRWRGWSLSLGVAAAAALVLFLLWPSSADERGSPPNLREPTPPRVVAPVPLVPRGAVARVDRFVWSRVPRVDRYRLRLYDAEGAVVWMAETADTVATRRDSVAVRPGVTYFWKVEAQTEWQRWVASDLVQFQLTGSSR